MRRLMEAIRAILSSVRWTAKQVWRAGRWATELVVEYVVQPVVSFADALIDVPMSILRGLGGRGAGVGPQSASAAQGATQQVQEATQQTQAAIELQKRAAAFQAAAECRLACEDDWAARFGDALTPGMRHYLASVSAAELTAISGADPRTVMAFLGGKAPRVAGCRTQQELTADLEAERRATDVRPGTPTPASKAAADISDSEDAVLRRFGARLSRFKSADAAKQPSSGRDRRFA